MLALCCLPLLVSRGPGFTLTSAVYTAELRGSANTFTGATFVPSVAPVVTAGLVSARAVLSWQRVFTSGGEEARYRVVRTDRNGSTDVCTGTMAPVSSGNTVSCADPTLLADVSYTYSQQPVLVRNSTTTWSRPLGSPSATIVGPRIAFAGVGATVSTTGPAVSIPFPNGTQPGDILLLVSVSGRQNAPSVPTGWTTLASVGVSGAAALRLFVAWRQADGSSSLTWDPSANSTGATVRILRFVRGNGNLATPILDPGQVVTSTRTAAQAFTPSVDLVTTATNSRVVNISAQRNTGSLAMTQPRGFELDHVEIATPGGVSQSLGVAGKQDLASGAVASPTWSSSISDVWASVTLAIR